jgi:hypothetical protein
MNRFFRQFTLLLTLCVLAACQSDAPAKPEQPAWITDPQDGAVGSAVTHVRGRHAQEELAITRARERLAARFGVELSSVQTILERVVNEKAYVTSNKQIEQAISKREIKAHVRATWYDERRDVVWAWVYPVN